MKNEIERFLREFGVYKVGIANPKQGFEMARSGCHPKNVMKNCNSVVVFAFHVGLDYYTSFGQKRSVESRVFNIYRDWISLQLANFLKEEGYDTVIPHGFLNKKEKIALLSFKLAAYEAGLGIFGRPNLLITPEYGPRVNLGVVLTEAEILPFDKPLEGFNPCQKCEICVRLCPVKAIDKELPPPLGFNRSRCVEFVYKIREKTRGKIMLCGYCYNHCPIGQKPEKILRLGRWKALADLNEEERKRLLRKVKTSLLEL